MSEEEIRLETAEKIMGWRYCSQYRGFVGASAGLGHSWWPASSMDHAMMIVEKLDRTPFIMERLTNYFGIPKAWNVTFVWNGKPNSAYAETLPTAICLAGLKAVNRHPIAKSGTEKENK